MDLRVVELRRRTDGRVEEHPAPSTLPSRSVTILEVYGSLLYAGARTLEARLPNPSGAQVPVVVLRLRGRTSLGATAFTVLQHFADRLHTAGGRLYLSGVDPTVVATFRRAGQLDEEGPLRIAGATSIVGESTDAAATEAEAWIAEQADR
jgi:SulP family sulfate permease